VTVDRKTAARTLRRIADLLEVHGSNPHRVRAFANAARAVERVDGDLGAMVEDGSLLDIRGIGKGTAAVVADLADGRRPATLVELDEITPVGLTELFEIEGLGPKKVKTLWRELDITSAGELEYACRENRLVDLPGFGPKSQDRLLGAVRFHLVSRERQLIHQAWESARQLARLMEGSGDARATVAGELRRGLETVGQIDLVVAGSGDLRDSVTRVLTDADEVAEDRWRGVTYAGLPVQVLTTTPGAFPVTMVLATGSDGHLEALRRRAAAVGMTFDGRGLRADGQPVEVAGEPDVYQALGCRWVPPELREGGDEVERSAAGRLPELVAASDLLGALHNHTTDSDGSGTVAEMAAAAADLGWRFLGVADHSPAAHYANGLSAERLRAQWREIDRINGAGGGPRVIKGLEADILFDGGLDIPRECESGLEYVVASVHSSFRLTEEDQTARVVAAVRHPACRVLGHPTGRLLLARPGYELDLEAVLIACAEEGVAVEINASPYRLDLDHRWAKRAVELGIPLAINPDAHSVEGLEDVRWGVTVARRAGATPIDVLNCGDIEQWLASRT
jgi:DNA polymerase (family 10)